jgi:recombination protein RecT
MPTRKPLDEQIDQAQQGQAVEVVRTPPPSPIREELTKARPSIEAALPPGFPGGADRFARIVLTAVRMNPDLNRCTVQSVLGAAMQAAQLGLTPGVLGECWIIPYKNRDTGLLEAQYQNGWKGLTALAWRAGFGVRAHAVHRGDRFSYSLGLEPGLVHEPADEDRGEAFKWYAVVTDRQTGRVAGFAVVDKAHVELRRQFGRSANSPAWRNWYSEMALGKAVREALRTVPMTTELAEALASEGVVRTTVEGQADEWALTETPRGLAGPDELELDGEEVDPS